jgi:LPXTG-site transpeptidase (sortase) family protein
MLDFFRLVPKKRSVKIKSKNGIIFSNPSGDKKYFFYGGTGIFLLAVGYFCYLYWPLAKSFVNYKSHGTTTSKIDIGTTEVAVDEFVLKIPKIGAEAKVVKNVSPFNKQEYLPILNEEQVAQAKGSGLPGEMTKAVYLFAHSTQQGLQMARKNSVFYLLGELRNDDPIFVRYNGKIYGYRVYDQKIIGANDIGYLSYKEEGREILILQTCWPLGTDWKRLLVFAERI